MEAIWQWGLDVIHTVQSVHGPVLDTIFKAITFLGEEDFFLILLPLVLWCVDFAFGARLAKSTHHRTRGKRMRKKSSSPKKVMALKIVSSTGPCTDCTV